MSGKCRPLSGEAESVMHLFADRFVGLSLEAWRSYLQSYEGGFAQVPGAESHGGSTYCAVATLFLIFRAHKARKVQLPRDHNTSQTEALFDFSCISKTREDLIRWCVFRQRRGFNGRPNKPEDSCYTFWIGATLKVISMIRRFITADLFCIF